MKINKKELEAYNFKLNVLMPECIKELNAINIKPSDKIKNIKANVRARKRMGCCKKVAEGFQIGYELEISAMLMDKEEKIIKEVILHELLHTCEGCFNHKAMWKYYAAKANREYGYNIETRANYEDMESRTEKEVKYRYMIVCQNCGIQMYRMKKSKLVKSPNSYRCSKCGGSLVVRELLSQKNHP